MVEQRELRSMDDAIALIDEYATANARLQHELAKATHALAHARHAHEYLEFAAMWQPADDEENPFG